MEPPETVRYFKPEQAIAWVNRDRFPKFPFPASEVMPSVDARPVSPAAAPSVSTPQAAPASEPVTLAALPTIKNKLRTNSLDVAIKKAIQQAESLDTGAVYLKLRELALSGEVPFSGVVEGNALRYTDDKNQSAKLSKPNLGKRLKNYTLHSLSGRGAHLSASKSG
jgi:hypothetical protein